MPSGEDGCVTLQNICYQSVTNLSRLAMTNTVKRFFGGQYPFPKGPGIAYRHFLGGGGGGGLGGLFTGGQSRFSTGSGFGVGGAGGTGSNRFILIFLSSVSKRILPIS